MFKEARELIATIREKDPAAHGAAEIIFAYPGFHAVMIHRFAHWCAIQGWTAFARWVSQVGRFLTGIEIHPKAKIGRRVFFDHAMGVVIGETAEIGSGVKIYQGVTLGALSFPKDACGKIIKGNKRHPTIEDNVTIYAGATILGAVTVGHDAIIGGNVWITDNVEPGTKISISPPQLTISRPNPKNAVSSWDLLPGAMKQEMLDSAEAVLAKSIRVKKNETTLLIYDRTTVNIAHAFMEAAEKLGLSGKVDVRLKPRKSPYMQSFAVEEDHPLVKILQEEFYSVTGKDLPCAYDASVCDSNIVAVSLGIPVVTFGPSGGNMHGDNEYGYAWQVKNCGEVYRRTVARLLGGEV